MASIYEDVTYYYYTDGSVSYNTTPTGSIEVEVPNTEDVLQYLRLNLSNAEIVNTNLIARTAYAPVAASPTIGDATRLLLNTDNSPKDIGYLITEPSVVPVIGLVFNYMNVKGGSDLSAGDTDTFLYQLSITATKDLEEVYLSFNVPLDNYGSNDAAHLYNPSVSGGYISVFDSDVDGIDESLVWYGDIDSGATAGIDIYVYADMSPGINFDEAMYSLDLFCTSCVEAIDYGPTFTGLSFSDLFSRGPINNGIYMVFGDNTSARGFIKNIAEGLSYTVDGWRLYNISNFDSPLVESSDDFILSPGEIYNTGWHLITNASEKYFTVAFDWGVVWGPSVYQGITRSFIDLPELYVADISLGKSSIHKISDEDVSVDITSTYLGHEALEIASISINTSIPYKSDGGVVHTWDQLNKSDIFVYHINSTGNRTLLDITPEMLVVQMPMATEDGFVYLNIDDLSVVAGNYLKLNNDISMVYAMSTSPIKSQNIFSFNTAVVAKTLSGTPISLDLVETVTLYGEEEVISGDSGGSSGSGSMPSIQAPVFELVKDNAASNFIDSNTVEISGTYMLISDDSVDLDNMTVILDIPESAILFDYLSVDLLKYDSKLGSWVSMGDQNILVSELYSAELNRMVYSININNYGVFGSGPILKDNDLLKLSYTLTLPYGTYNLLLRALIPATDTIVVGDMKVTDIHIPLRIINDVGSFESLEIKESEYGAENILVGIPPVWTKTIEVYNPNTYTVSNIFDIELLSDFLNIDLTEDDGVPVIYSINSEDDFTVDWKGTFKGNESKTYILNIITAPVIRTQESLIVLDSDGDTLQMLADITLKNPSGADYKNVTFIYPEGLDVVNITDSYGTLLEYSIVDSGTIIQIPLIKNDSSISINIIYDAYSDVLVINLDNLTYTKGKTNYTVLYVPSRDERQVQLSLEVLGPSSSKDLDTFYAEVILLENVSVHKEVNIFDTLNFNPSASGVYTILVRAYSKDRIIGSDYETFNVEVGPIKTMYMVGIYLVGSLIFLLISLMLVRLYRKKEFNDNLVDLKKKLNKI
ncbi:MAG: hypothetical protein GQ477_04990 [Nanohaloarchaea archaeon]|nr:hypothetical protein [Candidatus Nanohaloarchaea archaeon]